MINRQSRNNHRSFWTRTFALLFRFAALTMAKHQLINPLLRTRFKLKYPHIPRFSMYINNLKVDPPSEQQTLDLIHHFVIQVFKEDLITVGVKVASVLEQSSLIQDLTEMPGQWRSGLHITRNISRIFRIVHTAVFHSAFLGGEDKTYERPPPKTGGDMLNQSLDDEEDAPDDDEDVDSEEEDEDEGRPAHSWEGGDVGFPDLSASGLEKSDIRRHAIFVSATIFC